MLVEGELYSLVTDRLCADRGVKSVVLFGSRTRPAASMAAADRLSDIDLHVITSRPSKLTAPAWAADLSGVKLCVYAARPLSPSVHKVTILFSAGEVDLIVLQARTLRFVRLITKLGMHRRFSPLRTALNEMSTILRGGYRFVKGEKEWGPFYRRVVNEFPGRRISAEEAGRLADVFLVEFVKVLRLLNRGEMVAAQRILHVALVETNFRFLHESRLRLGVPTFGDGRRVENLLDDQELNRIRIDASLDKSDLTRAAWWSLAAMKQFSANLAPGWKMPLGFEELANRIAVEKTDLDP